MFGAYGWLQPGDGLLHCAQLLMGGVSQLSALFDLAAGALQLGGIAAQQVVEFALEADACVLRRARLLRLKAHQGRKIVTARVAFGADPQQGQRLDGARLRTQGVQFAGHVRGQFTAPATDQFVAA